MAGRAGKLDTRIFFREESTVRDLVGGTGLVSWDAMFSVWANVEFVNDSEKFAAAERSATITARFKVRHSTQISAITPKNRIYLENVPYEITGKKPTKEGRDRFVEFTTAARNDNGE